MERNYQIKDNTNENNPDNEIFKKISIDDCDWAVSLEKTDYLESCDLAFASNYIWRDAYDVQITRVLGCEVIRYSDSKQKWCTFPMGDGDKKAAIKRIKNICEAKGEKLGFFPLSSKDKRLLEEWFPGEFLITADRDSFDYVYMANDLAALKGRKYQGKRNHINRFKDNENWEYISLTKDNVEKWKDKCLKLEKDWESAKLKAIKSDVTISGSDIEKLINEFYQERKAIMDAFENYEKLGLRGGILLQNDSLVAFTIGEPLNKDTMVVHFEKAYSSVQGAYPMINQQFVLNECEGYTYINREDDTGDEGLRKAKNSYHPAKMIRKYVAIQSDVVYVSPKDKEQIINLWQECFNDEREYIDMYLSMRYEENNMLGIYEKDKLVSMASFLDCKVKMEGKYIDAKYVYAVATLKDRRCLGYASKILEYAKQLYGNALVLKPQTNKLRKYYSELGFVNLGKSKGFRIFNALTDLKLNIRENDYAVPSPSQYKKIRDNHFDKDGYVMWDDSGIAYAIHENDYCGGKTIIVGENDVCMFRNDEDGLRIIESTLSMDKTRTLAYQLMLQFAASKAFLEHDAGMIWTKEGAHFENGYLELTLG